MSISPIGNSVALPTPQPQTITPAAPAGSSGNNITLNETFNVSGSNIQNLFIANEINIAGDNNNITLNETVNIGGDGSTSGGSGAPSITPTINQDGTLSFSQGDTASEIKALDSIANEIKQLEVALLSPDANNQAAAAYQATQNMPVTPQADTPVGQPINLVA